MLKMLKKPFVLTLMLILIIYIVTSVFNLIPYPFRLKYSIFIVALAWAISAFCLGIIYTSIYKIEMPKNHKIKVVLYCFFMLTFIYLTSLMLIKMLTIRMMWPFPLMIIGSLCMYPALGLGCKVVLKIIKKNEI